MMEDKQDEPPGRSPAEGGAKACRSPAEGRTKAGEERDPALDTASTLEELEPIESVVPGPGDSRVEDLTDFVKPVEKPSQSESLYREIIVDEISFSKATGYDLAGTAVVPLAALARHEEKRLRERGIDIKRDLGIDPEPEPESDEGGGSIPVGEIIDVLRAAQTVEEVASVLVEIISNLIPRVLLLWERRGQCYGFASRGMDLTEVKLLTIEVPKGVLQHLAACELELEPFVGPPNKGGLVDRFFGILGHTPPEVLLMPVQVTADDRWLLYADNRDQPLPELELRLLDVIASRAGARADLLLARQSIW